MNTFDVSLHGEKIHVKRHFAMTDGSIDLDIAFKPSGDKSTLTVRDIHIASLRLAMQHLQELLDKAQAAQAADPGHPVG